MLLYIYIFFGFYIIKCFIINKKNLNYHSICIYIIRNTLNNKTKGHQLIKSSNIEILMKKPKIIKIHVFLKGL